MISNADELCLAQAKRIIELNTEIADLKKLTGRPFLMGTRVFCVIGRSVVEGYVFSYEDVYNLHTKEITRVIKIALYEEDGFINKSLNEVGKTILPTWQEAIKTIK